MYYEVLYYKDEECNDHESFEFRTKKEAMKFYEEHKKDNNKFYFWVTKRDEDGFVIEDIIY